MNEAADPQAWVAKAQEDYDAARLLIRGKKPLLYSSCFHSQQCAEKYLKAVLVDKGQDFPKTHDLVKLQSLCASAGVFLEMTREDLDRLSIYGVHLRYPGLPIDLKDAQAALATAKLVRQFARKTLGLK